MVDGKPAVKLVDVVFPSDLAGFAHVKRFEREVLFSPTPKGRVEASTSRKQLLWTLEGMTWVFSTVSFGWVTGD